MIYTDQMPDTYTTNSDKRQLAQAIDTLMTRSQACTALADACLSVDPAIQSTQA